MAAANYANDVLQSYYEENNVYNISEEPIAEDTYYYSEERSCAAKCLAEFRQQGLSPSVCVIE